MSLPDFESRICSRWRKSNNATSLKEVNSGRLYSIHLVIMENGNCKSQVTRRICKYAGSVDFDPNQSSDLLGYNLKFSKVGSIKLFENFGSECYGMLKYQQIYLCLCNLEQRWLHQVQELHHGKQEESIEL
ncbi:hypothetical protein H5410_040279 [Solanum commersonii]|uniref:Uncharacterized protein n=1 Tax=Solanum commersonii TaxID=4109 RepID=A0A9J5XPM8_SOLCO|nr:hypothetical protein H5410_040279 [Solanum commersonii]